MVSETTQADRAPLSSDPSFFARAGTPRYLWHPRVHEHFKEYCHLFLVTGVEGGGQAVVDELDRICASLEISASSTAIVFGPYDVLLRIWLTDGARARLREEFRRLASRNERIAGFLEFQADDLEYNWTLQADAPSQAKMDNLERDIRHVVKAQQAGEWTEQSINSLELLDHSSLVHQVKPGGTFKFYMFLKPLRDDGVPIDYAMDQLRESVGSVVNPETVTVYAGRGFCTYVLKATTDSYHEVLPIVERVQNAARKLRLRSWTLVPADTSLRSEGETILAILNEMPAALDPLLRSETGDRETIRRVILSMPSEQQEALATAYTRSMNELDEQGRERLHEILKAVILENRSSINQSLSFLTSIEGDARFLLPKLASIAGEEGLMRMRETLRQTPEPEIGPEPPPKSDVARASLAGLLAALRDISEFRPVGEILERAMGPSWQKSTRDIFALRNKYAHSRLTEELLGHDFAGTLGGYVRIIALSIKFQIGLERLRQNIEHSTNLV